MAAKVIAHFTASVKAYPCLRLPFSIVNKHLCSGPLLIQGPNGADHNVEVVKQDNKIYLGDGWRMFEQEQGINTGDILLCLLYKCPVLWIEVIEKKGKKKRKMEYCSGSNYLSKMSVKLKQKDDNVTRKKTKSGRVEAERARSDPESSTDKKLKGIIQAARKRLNDRYDIVEFTSPKLRAGKCTISKHFAANISVEKGGTVDLVALPGSKKEQIRWCPYLSSTCFGAGWKKFCVFHEIKEGDWALLELASNNTIHMHIYHCNNPYSTAHFCEHLEKCYK